LQQNPRQIKEALYEPVGMWLPDKWSLENVLVTAAHKLI